MSLTHRYLKALPLEALRLAEALADAAVSFRLKEVESAKRGDTAVETIYNVSVSCYRDALGSLGLAFGQPEKVKRYLSWRFRKARVTP